jgi:hypothetical protein
MVTAVFVLLVVGGAALARHVVFASGTINDPNRGYFAEMVFLLSWLVSSLVLVIWGIASTFKERRIARNVTARLGLTLTVLLGSIIALMIAQPAPSIFLAGFERWASMNVDVQAIRQWLVTDGSKYAGNSYVELPNGFPKCLVSPNPRLIKFDAARQDGMIVQLIWSMNWTGSWAVVIGPPTMEEPQVDVIEARSLRPGVYVVDRGG